MGFFEGFLEGFLDGVTMTGFLLGLYEDGLAVFEGLFEAGRFDGPEVLIGAVVDILYAPEVGE